MEPGASTPEFVVLGLIFAGAAYLFWSGRLRSDLVAVCVMLALILPWPRGDGWRGILTHREGFSGFGSPAVIMVGAMFVLGAAIVRTGLAEALGGKLFRACAHRESLLQAAVLTMATVFSMFVNDTAVVLVFMPILLLVCRENKLAPGRYLIALGYGSLLGGQWTLIGTRSNVVISDYLLQRTGSSMGFFDLAPMAAVIFACSAASFFLVGRRFLPSPTPAHAADQPAAAEEFVVEAAVTEHSRGIGRTLQEWIGESLPGASVLAVIRDGVQGPAHRDGALRAGDVLLFRGPASSLRQLLKSADLKLKAESALGPKALRGQNLVTVEALIAHDSAYLGSSAVESRLGPDFGFTAVGLSRRGQRFPGRPAEVPLQRGDLLLLLGHADGLHRLKHNRNILLLEQQDFAGLGRSKALIVLLLLAGVVVAAIGSWLSPAISIPLAALLAVLSRCIRASEIYRSIDWPSLVTVAGIIPFGLAIEKTGAAKAVAESLVELTLPFGPMVALGGMLLLALLITQFIENAAAAIILAPIAYHVAEQAGVSPKPFLLGTALCVSAAFCTPVAHESTILVMGPGGYRFGHYLRIGGMMALLTWLLATLATPVFWPLR